MKLYPRPHTQTSSRIQVKEQLDKRKTPYMLAVMGCDPYLPPGFPLKLTDLYCELFMSTSGKAHDILHARCYGLRTPCFHLKLTDFYNEFFMSTNE